MLKLYPYAFLLLYMKKSRFFSLHAYIQSQWLRPNLLSYLLLPLSGFMYLLVHLRRLLYRWGVKKSYRASLPVIVVGNIFVGGTGKTPLSIALVQNLSRYGWQTGVISRGYGVSIGPQARSAFSATAKAAEIGDEPSLMAAYAPVAVHPNRRLAIEKLLQDYPQTNLIIADDGLQHLALQRDIEIVVQDNRGIGNGFLLPAGPLREPKSRLQEVDYIVTNGPSKNDQTFEKVHATMEPASFTGSPKRNPQQTTPSSKQVNMVAMWLKIHELEQLRTGQRLSLEDFLAMLHAQNTYPTTPVYAIAGIGQPERFFTSLREQGIHPTHCQGFADHYRFQAEDFQAYHQGLILMTSKDASKCRSFATESMWVVHVGAEFSDTHFFQLINEKLRQLPLY